MMLGEHSSLPITHCGAYRVHGYLDGTTKPKDPTDANWDNLDNLVKSWLDHTMSQSLLTMILKPQPTTNSVWDTLDALFRDNNYSSAIELDNELRSLVQGDRAITDYCQKMKAISDLLANIDGPVPEKTLVTYMLNGLSPNFENIYMLIRHKELFPSFLEARSTLVSKEFRVNRPPATSPSHYDHGSSPFFLLANSNNTNWNHSNNSNRRPYNNRPSSNRRPNDASNNH
ncbi:unnamed protein product [Lactuca virosa]|uniref:Retrotransposon gag domain-containing protein n=1 Tax=Lactuca virosa TaxID=75947 RepID=A0AAU9PNX2_9ASTR|nr:unnamed protein product [Lactuca virosa]